MSTFNELSEAVEPAHREELLWQLGLKRLRETVAHLQANPQTHDQAQAEIGRCVRRIQHICDNFGYDPTEWLNDETAIGDGSPSTVELKS